MAIDNLLANGGFETGDLTGWTVTQGYAVDASDASWVSPHSGAWMLRLVGTATSDPIPVAGMSSMRVGLWNDSYDADRHAKVQAVFDVGGPIDLGSVSSGSQSWAYDEFGVAVPAGATSMRVRLTEEGADMRIDDVAAGWGPYD